MKKTVGISLLFLLAACSEQKSTQERWHAHAPQSQNETGIVVQLDDSTKSFELKNKIDTLLEKNQKVEVRAVNTAHGIYEFFNISQADLNKALGSLNATSYQNIYIKNINPKPRLSAMEHLKAVDVEKCLDSETAPVLNVQIVNLAQKLKSQNPIIDLKDGAVSFSAAQSQTGVAGATLDYLWLVQGPAGSAVEYKLFPGVDLTFTPDLPGEYSVGIVVQDTSLNCSFGSFGFGVTYNQPYNGPAAPRTFDPVKDDALFFHLKEVGATEAWKTASGKGVVIAIVDSGVNYNHPDLQQNIFVNSKEVANNNIDDDGNGFVDDVTGWDFSNQDNMPIDDNMHGTHVAGIAASAVSGVAKNAKILPVKVMSAFGGGDLASILSGILYAVDNGADIINLSLGADTFGMTTAQIVSAVATYDKVINYAKSHNVMVVMAAGNGYPQDPAVFGKFAGLGYNIDGKYPALPAAISESNTITVASVDSFGSLVFYSNYGPKGVNIGAPGGTPDLNPQDSINTAKPIMAAYYLPSIGNYVGLEGTSMATPVVAGALAVLKSAYPKAGVSTLLAAVETSASVKTALTGKISSGGVLNIPAALKTLSLAPTSGALLGTPH